MNPDHHNCVGCMHVEAARMGLAYNIGQSVPVQMLASTPKDAGVPIFAYRSILSELLAFRRK